MSDVEQQHPESKPELTPEQQAVLDAALREHESGLPPVVVHEMTDLGFARALPEITVDPLPARPVPGAIDRFTDDDGRVMRIVADANGGLCKIADPQPEPQAE